MCFWQVCTLYALSVVNIKFNQCKISGYFEESILFKVILEGETFAFHLENINIWPKWKKT